MEPSSGINGTTFFIGTTASHLSQKWYTYISPGVTLTTTHHQIKDGNIFIYQAGFGYNLGNPWGTTFVALFDVLGSTTQKTVSFDIDEENTGGTLITTGPTLTMIYNTYGVRLGFLVPCYQRLNGIQLKQHWQASLTLVSLF